MIRSAGIRALLLAFGLLPAVPAWSQAGQPQQAPQVTQNPPVTGGLNPLTPAAGPTIRPDYVLGPNDQVLIHVPQADEINDRPFRIGQDGFIDLPVVGRLKADGLNVQGLENEVTTKLREYFREPLVSITVTQFRSEPVFFVGAFRTPGIYPLGGRRTLVEMMTAVGGILPNASHRIKVTRRAEFGPIPLPNVVVDPIKKVSTVEISLESLTQDINPAEDIALTSYDVISVDRSEPVYVAGEVTRVSAIELGERATITVMQALTEAGGFTPLAQRDKVRILRPVLGTNLRHAIEIDMKRVSEGKDVDFALLPNDVLYVPRSGTRAAVASPISASVAGTLPSTIVALLLRFYP